MADTITYHQFIYGKNTNNDAHYIEVPRAFGLREFIIKGGFKIVHNSLIRENINNRWFYIISIIGKAPGIGLDKRVSAYRNIVVFEETMLLESNYFCPFLYQEHIIGASPFSVFIPEKDQLEMDGKTLQFDTEKITIEQYPLLEDDYQNLLFSFFSGRLSFSTPLASLQGFIVRLPRVLRRFLEISPSNFRPVLSNEAISKVVQFLISANNQHPTYFNITINSINVETFKEFSEKLYWEASIYTTIVDQQPLDDEELKALCVYLYDADDVIPNIQLRTLFFSLLFLNNNITIQNSFRKWSSRDYSSGNFSKSIYEIFEVSLNSLVFEEAWIDKILALTQLKTLHFDDDTSIDLLSLLCNTYLNSRSIIGYDTFKQIRKNLFPKDKENYKKLFLYLQQEDRIRAISLMVGDLQSFNANDDEIFEFYQKTIDSESLKVKQALIFTSTYIRDLKKIKTSLLDIFQQEFKKALIDVKDSKENEKALEVLDEYLKNVAPIDSRVYKDLKNIILSEITIMGFRDKPYEAPAFDDNIKDYKKLLVQNFYIHQIRKIST